jgi:membrane associated rhomboid family serine protease
MFVSQRQPVFNAPTVVFVVLGAFLAVFVAADPEYGFLPDGPKGQLLDILAFLPERLGPSAGGYPGGRTAGATQFVTHLFVHGDLTHLAINAAWFLAFATPVARRLGTARFLAFFFLCGIGGALLFLPFNSAPMVGASGAISGLMGAALRFLFVPLSDGDHEALSGAGRRPPCLSLSASLTDRRILIAIAFWTLLNMLAAWGAQAILEERNIAWEAHLGGFFTGLLTFGLFDPKPPVHPDSAPAA